VAAQHLDAGVAVAHERRLALDRQRAVLLRQVARQMQELEATARQRARRPVPALRLIERGQLRLLETPDPAQLAAPHPVLLAERADALEQIGPAIEPGDDAAPAAAFRAEHGGALYHADRSTAT
jgi:hypothetical protein